jgi:hypothetical protein
MYQRIKLRNLRPKLDGKRSKSGNVNNKIIG